MKKSKKKTIIIVLIVIILLLIYGIYRRATKKYTSIDDFLDVKELVEYYNCEYISLEKSEEEGFEKDLRMKFDRPPINEVYMTSNQEFYEKIICAVDKKLNDKDIRILDEERGLVIKVKYNSEEKTVQYKINDDSDYFKNQLSKLSKNNNESIKDLLNKKVEKNIKSDHLRKVMNGNWNSNIDLGKKYKFDSNRNIYWDEAIETNIVASKIMWIKFTERYSSEIIDDIKTGMTKKDIIEKLGKPDFQSTLNDSNANESKAIIGYVFNSMYFFFVNGEIYVSNVEKLDEAKDEQFIKAIDNMNETGDYRKFADNLTSIYPDYKTYYSNEDFITIEYPQKGFSLRIGNSDFNGITIYSNYQGSLKAEENKNNVLFRSDLNGVFEMINQDKFDDIINRNPNYGGKNEDATENYNVLIEENDTKLYSIDKSLVDIKINARVSSIKEYNNEYLIYSVDGEGIYAFNISTKESKLIKSIAESINIEKVEGNSVYYNNGNVLNLK